jgi:hypothetical protein
MATEGLYFRRWKREYFMLMYKEIAMVVLLDYIVSNGRITE